MNSVKLLAGLCALLLGRQIFWLFVGVVGFGFGMDITAQVFRGSPEIVVVAIALLGGVAGAALAHWMEEFMVGVSGFLAGGYIAAQFLTVMMPYAGRYIWLALLLGGLIGAMLFLWLFDWALILVSSLVGAGFIVQALQVNLGDSSIAYLSLAAFGIIVQGALNRRWPPPPRL